MKVNCAQLGSVTRLDYLLQFVQFFQSLWQQLFGQHRLHFKAIFVKVSKSLISLVKIIFGQNL